MKTLYFLILVLFLSSCKNSDIYNSGTIYQYIVQSSVSEYDDTLRISVSDGFFINKIKIEAKMTIDENNKISKTIETLYTANDSGIRLANPIGEYFDKSLLICPPYVKFPLEIGNKYTYQWKVDGEKFGQKDGIEVKSDLEITGKVDNDTALYNDNTWEINCVSKSKLGEFTSKYYFNSENGFVYLEYQFDDYNIKVNLETITEKIEL